MLVYGDKVRLVRCGAAIHELENRLRDARDSPHPAAWKCILVDAGELCQGLLDHWWEARGRIDSWGAGERWCSELMLAIASRHWDAALRLIRHSPDAQARLRCKVPEGFAWYALDPVLYQEASRGIPGSGAIVIIGIRSIGVSLAAIASAELGPVIPHFTLRLTGHPFSRRVSADESIVSLVRTWSARARFVVVDEGPGLSGSTFRGTARWLEELGVDSHRIHLLPGHEGLPPMAAGGDLKWWKSSQRHVGRSPPLGEEIGGGLWRRLFWTEEAKWPASNPAWERRKALVRAKGGVELARFAGLGSHGHRALNRARALAEAGFSPPVRELRDGYLFGPWIQSARPALRDEVRRIPLEFVARYLAFIASSFPSRSPVEGASPGDLLQMAWCNAQELGIPHDPSIWEHWRARLPALESRICPVRVDARLRPCEWIELPDGVWLKTDSLDHHASHELPGAQDCAWDVAAAGIELELDEAGTREIADRVGAAIRRKVDHELMMFLQGCYLAYHAGYWDMTVRSVEESEAARASRERDRYVGLLLKWTERQ